MDTGGRCDNGNDRGPSGRNTSTVDRFWLRFVVDPTEPAAGARAVRVFFPVHDPEAAVSSSSFGGRTLTGQQQQYGGHGEILLGHGQEMPYHRYHQFGTESRQQDAGQPAVSALPWHSSLLPGFFFSPIVEKETFLRQY
ncbi:unnamed protein product [Urochloa humidicola]